MQTNMNSTESKTDSTNQETNDLLDSTEETHDDLGYELPKELPKPPKQEEKKLPTPPGQKAPETEIKTGYEDEPEAPVIPEEKKVEKTPEEMTAEEKAQKELDDAVNSLGDGTDKAKIKKFAADHKLTPAQVKAYGDLTKAEQAEARTNAENAKKAQRSAWHSELKTDPEFGGQHFDVNVKKVNEVLNNFLPDTKKVLTDKGSMLPPYIMKDFLRLHKVLNPVSKFEQGDPSVPEEANDPDAFLEDMYGKSEN